MDWELGWKGTKVRHGDGRAGMIIGEFVGFGFAGLTIQPENGEDAYIQLNVDGSDSGEKGWEWFCANFDGGPRWLPLGDHWEPGIAPNATPGLDDLMRPPSP